MSGFFDSLSKGLSSFGQTLAGEPPSKDSSGSGGSSTAGAQQNILDLAKAQGFANAPVDQMVTGTSTPIAEAEGADAGGAALLAASDKKLKKNIQPTNDKEIDQYVRSIAKPQSYQYKDQNTYGGPVKGGLMAQNLQKSSIGQTAVIKTPQGLKVDGGRLATIIAATTAHKITQIEDKLNQALLQLKRKK